MAQHVKTFLHNFIRAEKSWKLELLQKWPTIMGTLHEKVTVEKITDDMIVLGVTDSCWLQELYLLSELLLTTINKNLENHHIKTIRFTQAGVKQKKKSAPINAPVFEQPVVLRQYEEQALSRIQDPVLQEALKNFLIRCYREKKK